jgi:hypothetical protein
MNGINLKKLGAIVAGGAILASSVAFAGLVFQNTELVNANGQPVVKIVVGENAAASDGVAAAMIATKIANSAYASKDYTAAVQGTATCVAGNGSTGGATCTVTDKTVTLEIVYPGMTGTTITEFKPLIAETLDRTLDNRNVDDNDVTTDLMDEKAQPFQDQDGNFLADAGINEVGGVGDTYYMIDGSKLNAFADYTMSSAQQSSSSFTESQRIFLKGKTAYDSSEKAIEYVPDTTLYQIVFGPDEDGLSLCPGDTSQSIGTCGVNDELGKNRYALKLFGEQWVISGVEGTTGEVKDYAGLNDFVSDRSISVPASSVFKLKLAKEAKYNPALHKGECMNTTDVKICLSDIARETGEGNTHPAILSIYDTAGNLVTEKQVAEGATETVTVGSKDVKIHVYQTAPGYAMQAMWADIAIYMDEIELNEGKAFTYGIKGYSGDESKWNVYFGLVDKNGPEDNVTVADATGLRTLTFATSDSDAQGGGDVYTGDSYYVIDTAKYQGFEVKNNGLETAAMDPLKFEWKYSGSAPVANITKYVKITTSQDRGFEVNGESWKKGGLVIIGYNETAPMIALKDYDGDWHSAAYSGQDVKYTWAGDEGDIYTIGPSGTSDSPGDFAVYFDENVGKVLDIDSSAVNEIEMDIDATNNEINTGSTDTDLLRYWQPFTPSAYGDGYGYDDDQTVEVGFVTMRGSEYSSQSKTTRTIQVPKSVRHVQMALMPTSLNASRNSEIIGPLHEGDSATVGGSITVTVDAISVVDTATVSGGTSGAATADMSGVTAVIKDASGASMSTLTAQSVYAVDPATLTYLDSQAPATGTVITVGGPKVNSVTAAAMQGAAIDLSAANPVVTTEAGDKIIVAGWTAADTITAASNFIAALKAQ